MKAVSRKLIAVVVCIMGLGLLALTLAMFSPVQTWIARRVLANRPELKAELGRLEVELNHIVVQDARFNVSGALMNLPKLEVTLPMNRAVFHQELNIANLVARGWTLDLTHFAPSSGFAAQVPVSSASFSLLSSAYAANPEPLIKAVFQGVFAHLHLPIDLILDEAILEGTVILPMGRNLAPAAVQVSLVGGGLKSNQEAVFTLQASLALADQGGPVNEVRLVCSINAVMDTPRSFSKIAAMMNTQASGNAFPQGAQINTELSAARVSGGENYTVSLQAEGRTLLDIQASYPENSARLGGVWRLNIRDTDVAPFALGHALPSFEAVGAGMFETDTMFLELHTAGRIKSTADRLQAVLPSGGNIGPLTLTSEFNITQRGTVTRLDKLLLDIGRPDPLLSIQSLQSFEFDAVTGELKVADPNADLLAIDTLGFPIALLGPLSQEFDLKGGGIHGQIVASARDGGVSLHTRDSLKIKNLAANINGNPMVEALDISMNLQADYNPQGWQALINGMTVYSAGTELLKLDVKIGQLQGNDQPLKVTGVLRASLAGLSHQPIARRSLNLSRGKLLAEFVASIGTSQEVQGKLNVTDLAVPSGSVFPSFESNARFSRSAMGRITFNLPLTITNAKQHRSSDLTASGLLEPILARYKIEGRLQSGLMYVEDLEIFAGLAASPMETQGASNLVNETDARPFWDGLSGSLDLELTKLFYNDLFEMNHVTGVIRMETGKLKMEKLESGVGTEGKLKFDGEVGYNAQASRPYGLNAVLKMRDFDTAPLFRAFDPTNPPQIEGQFNVTSSITSQGRNPMDLFSRTGGDLQISSTGGMFRLIYSELTGRVETVGKVAAVGAFLGNVLSKNKSPTGISSKVQAVAEVSKLLSAIAYDQMNLSVTRDDSLNIVFKDFTLISPEVRLIGAGQLTGGTDLDWLQQPMSLTFQMKARGRTGEVMNYLNILSPDKDDLGYADCVLPLHIGGSLLAPDTSELNYSLVKLTIEHSGAGDLLNRLLGK
jgi:hypothetical protein